MTYADVAIKAPRNTDAGSLHLRTLVRLRWLAVAGQSIAVFFVHFVLGYAVPLGFSLGLIALSAWLNIFLSLRWRGGRLLQPMQAALLLGYDIAQLAGLLYLTGGLQNPFAFLFLVPITVSATSLPLRWTIAICSFGFLCGSFLAFYYLPLPWDAMSPLQLPSNYIAGMWAALASGAVFSALYARRIAVEARTMSSALAATEAVLAREQRLTALDGLAAAAAHELGTPLATIALVAKELKREMPRNSPHEEDIDLLLSQSARCREILSRLSSREHASDEIYERMKATAMLEELVAPLRGSDVEIVIDAQASQEGIPEPVFRRNPAIMYGIGNVLENAIDFATSRVSVMARWSRQHVDIMVTDDGPGFEQNIIDRLGDPFVTTRPGYDDPGNDEALQGKHPGMGLGLFIAKTLLERSGAAVTLSNQSQPQHGARIQMRWPRAAVDVAKIA
jgi:two-component system, sensor histidine kinase RegB